MSEVTFPEGWVGCADWQRFALDLPPETAPIGLLRSLDEPELSFIVVDPWKVEPAFQPLLAEADREALGAGAEADLQWLSVLNVQNEPFAVTANLLGPLVVNPATGVARQVILAQSGYSAAHRLGQALGQALPVSDLAR